MIVGVVLELVNDKKRVLPKRDTHFPERESTVSPIFRSFYG